MIGVTLSFREPAIGLLYFVFAALGVLLARETGNVAVFWPPNAIVLGFLLRARGLNRPASFGFCFVANVGANMYFGDPLAFSASLAVVNMLEIWLALVLLERFAHTDLTKTSLTEFGLLTLLTCGVAAGAAAVVGALVVNSFVGAPFQSVVVNWWAADALGFAIFTPMILTFDKGLLRQVPPQSYAWLTLVALMSIAAEYCLLTMRAGAHFEIYFPLFALLALRFGQFLVCVAGAVVIVWTVLLLSLDLPFELAGGDMPSSFQTLLAQFFLCLLIFPGRFIATLAAQNRKYLGQINDQNRELEATNSEMRTILHVVSHDLKSPLVTIEGFSAMLQIHLKNEKYEMAEQASGRIQSGVKSMSALISDLLEINQLEREGTVVTAVTFGPLLDEVTDLLTSSIEDHQAEVEVNSRNLVLFGDRPKLVRALLNLIQNALRYGCPEPGMTIRAGATLVGNEVHIHVEDNGPGIDKRYKHKVFDLFFRGDARQNGTGAGLAIVKRVAQGHGGTAWVDETYAQGTRIVFSLRRPKGVK